MGEYFDAKLFNGEVFQKYVDRIPNVHLNQLIQSGAIVGRPELAQSMSDQVGGNFLTTPLKGLIGGDPLNYDGVTNITATSTKTYSHSRVVAGRAKAWTEKDFSYDITGGVDFMANVAQQVSEYWTEQDQKTLISILDGVFSMADTAGAEFVDQHTYDISALTNSEGKTGLMDATTLNTGIQKACGDHKGKFSLALMHSKVATNLENMKVLVYLKYNDANGMERDLSIATLNGRMVIIDDDMPVENIGTTAGVYTVTIGGSPATGEKYTVAGNSFTVASTQTTNAVVEGLVAAINADATSPYTAAKSSTTVIGLTEKTGKYGAGQPTVSAEPASGASTVGGTIVADTTTSPVVTPKYTTYVFGQGAIEYTNCGAKVPYEMARNPYQNGGEDTLISRQRKCWSPYGISFTMQSMSTLSPTNAELALGVNWELVNTGGVGKLYIPHKAIPIARLLSLG